MSFGARARIRLGALEHNLSVIRAVAPEARVMAVIKANAYGHGLVPVAKHLEDADSFAVARITEAIELRAAGVVQPVVLLKGVVSAEEFALASAHNLELVVHCREQIELLQSHPDDALTVWLKFDTGMNRLGFAPSEAATLIAEVRDLPAVRELRLMTHLADADTPDSPATAAQLAQFRDVAADFDGAASIANAPAVLDLEDIRDAPDLFGFRGEHWIRPGIALFGISPFEHRSAADLGLQPVMQFEALLIAKKRLAAGARVGYRGRFVSDTETTLGIISAGYGDGYTRHFRDGTPVLINGRRVALIGNVSMDMIAVDLGLHSQDQVGDIATLWGDGLPVEEVAPWADAIPYELVCGVMNREASEIVD
ncbi:MAG: alanine racemase [Woeseiaceae bacterium]|nr:alanine racemase [Woeseiaceae bacterium]